MCGSGMPDYGEKEVPGLLTKSVALNKKIRVDFIYFLVSVLVFIILPAVSALAVQTITEDEKARLIKAFSSDQNERLLPKDVEKNKEIAESRPKFRKEIEETSEFETYVRTKLPKGMSKNIKQFGYNLFLNAPTTFAPVSNLPVGPEYVIGPGDEIRINVWGKFEGNWSVTVDRNGNIFIPTVGTIGVAGLTFRELKEVLHKEISKYYTGFEMNVYMGSLRSITVYVVGNARKPGAYTVSSLSTLVNALFAAGGPSKSGSMRDIQVRRRGKTIVHFDLYNLLLRGDKSEDIRLMPEDVIFIPPVKKLVAVVGSVKKPAIYEIKHETTVGEVISMAGGISDIAFKGRVQIERISKEGHQTLFESDMKKAMKLKIRGGDIIKVFQSLDDRRTVKIEGAVYSPGEYGFKKGMRVKDLIALAGGLKYYAYVKQAELTRVTPTPQGPITKVIHINLERALAGDPEHNILLQQDDYILIRNIPEWELYNTVVISGEVKFPGVYTFKKGERLSSLIQRAGGFTEKAYLKGAVFTRESVKEIQQRQINEMIDRLETELLSVASAAVAVATSPDEAKIIQMENEQKRRFLARLRTVKAKGRITIRLSPNIEDLKNSPFDIELMDGDKLYIPSNPGTVQVIGSVYNQNVFIYSPGRGYEYYLKLAGGYTENADKDNVYILKVDGTALKVKEGDKGIVWNSERKRWERITAAVEPGDTIVVPEKLTRIAWMRNVKDITQIMFHIMATTGVLISAF